MTDNGSPPDDDLKVDIKKCWKPLQSIKFGFIELGEQCNASHNRAFTSAWCNIHNIKDTAKNNYTLDSKNLFKEAISLLRKFSKDEEPHSDANFVAAIKKLKTFYNHKALHETELVKNFLDENSKNTEENNNRNLAEHLFQILAPGQRCVLDDKTKYGADEEDDNGRTDTDGQSDTDGNSNSSSESEQSSGEEDRDTECKTILGITSIGHKDVWHGNIDIVLTEELDKKDAPRGDPGKRNIIEVKRTLTQQRFGCMNQAIAQTIAFSFIQRKERTKLFFVPNILISPKEFRVIMYDADNDYLICSQPMCIFTKSETKWILDKISIFFLWMVLHYDIFSGTVNLKTLFENNVLAKTLPLPALKAKFLERAVGKEHVYRDELTFCTEKISSSGQEYFPDKNSLENGENVLTKV